LTFGDNYGIPNWLADRINRIFCCSDVLVQNRAVVKVSGAKLEKSFIDRYPMGVWSLDVQDATNSYSDMYDFNTNPTPGGIGYMEIGADFIVS